MLPSIGVIILNWNNKDDTLVCLESLQRGTYPRGRVGLFVVDNASMDGSVEVLSERLDSMRGEEWRECELVPNDANLGFTGGNNAGYARLSSDYDLVYLSNDDIVFAADTLDVLARRMEADERIGAIGPRVLVHGSETELAHGAGYVRPLLCGTRSVDAQEETDCEFVTGCALCVRRAVVDELGALFDANFFAYWEDVDLCARVRKLGYRVVYCPETYVHHKVAPARPGTMSGVHSPGRVYLETHSKLMYARKHLALPARLAFYGLYLLRFPAFALRNALSGAKGKAGRLAAYAAALRDGFKGVPGRAYRG